MDNRAGEMQIFLRVVEAGGFSAAARRLRLTPSTISKMIGRIEDRLGVRLLERSTRRLSLTAEGRLYYERSAALLEDMDALERGLSLGAASAGGTVRVNASVALGVHGLEPMLPEFWRACPGVRIDLSLSDEVVDLYLDRTDVAFRVGRLPNSTLTARAIGATRRAIVAAPAYIAAHGAPQSVGDLERHECLGFNFRRSVSSWPARADGRPMDRAVGGPLLANNGETLRKLALAGAGLARLGFYHVRDDIAAGALVEVLPEASVARDEHFHAVYLGGPRLPQRVRLFLDFVCPRLKSFIEGD